MITEIKKFIESCHIMTLGTASQGQTWTAPVFYVYCGTDFYFFSKNTSRHIRDIRHSPRAAASIHHNPKDWQDIKGIQMEGIVQKAGGSKALKAFSFYTTRFSLLKTLPFQPFPGSLGSFEKQFKVEWYTFIPEKLEYLDNSVKFGYKLQLQPDLEIADTPSGPEITANSSLT